MLDETALVAVRTNGHTLGLGTLYFGDEVVHRPTSCAPPKTTSRHREMQLAEQLVEMRATKWDPNSYSDEYCQVLLQIIADKVPLDTPDAVDAFPRRAHRRSRS